MTELFVPLRVTPGITGIYLKPICGADEITVEDAGTKTGLSFLEGLIKKAGANNLMMNLNVAKIVTADRDRIFAHLYISIYGPKIASTVNCENCKVPFDLDFLLTDLLEHQQLNSSPPSDDGSYQIKKGTSFRLPTGEDELLLEGFTETTAEDFLMRRCLVKGSLEKDREIVQKKMAIIAPILNLDMQAHCPECDHNQQVQFDMQSFFLTKLKQERPQLIREIHCIAMNYHWSADSILGLPRSLRKQYVALIDALA
jgi:hypothetical protein